MSAINRIGFTQLEAGDGPYQLNIVFVHGLEGHPQETWGYDPEPDKPTRFKRVRRHLGLTRTTAEPSETKAPSSPRGSFWPEKFLTKDIPDARIWTYGYNADVMKIFQAGNQNSISAHARDLATQFERDLENEDPVVFIAHSLGGIVVKDAMKRSKLCRERTKLIIFLGTPHRGSAMAGWGEVASNLAQYALQDSNKDILRSLQVNSEILDNIQDEFVGIAHERSFKIHSFQEAKGLSGVKGFHRKVVEDFSSKVGLPPTLETIETLDADHRQMVRCITKSDAQYRAMLGVIQKFIRHNLQSSSVNLVSVPEMPTATPHIAGHESPDHGPYFYVPFPKNHRFTGRDQLLEELITKLFAPDSFQKAALFGLGGAGKTQVALQVAYWTKEKKLGYSVFWVPALSVATFEQAYTDILKTVGIQCVDGEDVKQTVQTFLNSKAAGKWLLIIDNADDIDILFEFSGHERNIYNYLPTTDDGRILFTTRTREVATWVAGSNSMETPQMTEDDATDFLRKSLHQNLYPGNQDIALVRRLLRELTYLPLAITQAAAYMNENQVDIAEYVQLFKNIDQDMVELMTSEFQDGTRYQHAQNPVATTWHISFNRIQKSKPNALKLLLFIMFIEPKAIPRSILPSVGSDQQLTQAIGTLCGYSFLNKRENGKAFDMHSLVHMATRLWGEKQDTLQEAKQDAILHMDRIFPSDDWDNRETWREYLPHGLKVLQIGENIGGKELCNLGHQVGSCLGVDGRVREQVGILETISTVQADIFAEDHPNRLKLQQDLALAYEADGQVSKAIKLLEKLVSIQANTLAEDHHSRLTSQNNLALAYRQDGQVSKAIELLEKVVSIRATTLAEDHPDRLASQNNLASAYRQDGQVSKAIELLEKVVSIEATTLAEDHPDRLASQNNLALAYEADGQVSKAIKLLKKVVSIQANTLAEDHHSRLTSQNNLALAYASDGQLSKAIRLLEKVVSIEATTLAEDHPDRLASQNNLARINRKLMKYTF